MLVKMFFVRHGETEGNLTNRFYDSPEIPLTELGRKQARDAGKALREQFLRGINEIYCSPWVRAKETCTLALEAIGMQAREIKFDERLRERSFSGLVGKRINWDGTLDDCPDAISGKEYQDIWTYGHPKSKQFGIETLPELKKRVVSFLNDVSGKGVSSSRYQKSIVVFSHGGFGRMLEVVCCDYWPKGGQFDKVRFLENGEIALWTYRT